MNNNYFEIIKKYINIEFLEGNQKYEKRKTKK